MTIDKNEDRARTFFACLAVGGTLAIFIGIFVGMYRNGAPIEAIVIVAGIIAAGIGYIGFEPKDKPK